MYITHLWDIHVALFLTDNFESCEVSDRQNQSVVNAFHYVLSHPPGLLQRDRPLGVGHNKVKQLFDEFHNKLLVLGTIRCSFTKFVKLY